MCCADGAVKPPWAELILGARGGRPTVVIALGDLDTKMVDAQAGKEGLPSNMFCLKAT